MRNLLMLTAGLAALAAGSAQAGAPETPPASMAAPDDQATPVAPVTVVATRTATPADEVPATVSVYTANDIEGLLATDIKDLIRYEPGVSVISQPARFGAALGTAGRGGNEGFTIRGLGGDRVLMIVDGIRQPDGFVFGAQSVGRGGYSDLDLMKSVEILRGSASALYGSDGVAGAVSMTTKDPEDILRAGSNFGARARVGYSSADEGLTEAVALAGRSGAFSGLLAYTHRDSSETETQGEATGEEITSTGGITYANRTMANPQDNSSDAILGKLVWAFAPNQRLRLTYENFQSDVDYNVLSGRTARTVAATAPTAATAVLGLTANDTTERERVSLDWRFTDAFGLDEGQVAVYGQDSTNRQYTLEDRVGTDRIRDNRFNNKVFGASAWARKTLTAAGIENRVTFGGDWSQTTQEGIRDGTVPPTGETFPTSPFPKTDYTLAGLYVQDEIVLAGGALKIIPAVRYDSYDLSTDADPLYIGTRADQNDSHVSPKIGAVWQITPRVQLFANYAEGFKAPTPSQVNNFFANLAFGYTSAPNPNLKPETSQSTEIGLRLRDQDFAFGKMSFQLVGFHSDYQDFISQQVVSGSFTPADPAVYQYVNFTSVEVNGLEAKASLYWDNGFSARFAAAYADGDKVDGTAATKLATIDPVKLVGGLAWADPAGRYGVEGVVTWSDSKKAVDSIGATCRASAAVTPAAGCYLGDAFTLVDITAWWNVTDQVTARVGAFNVFDEKYSWWSDINGVSATSAVTDAYTQPGRNFGVSLSLRL